MAQTEVTRKAVSLFVTLSSMVINNRILYH